MANLRILYINAADIRTIKVKFSVDLAEDLTTSHISVTSEDRSGSIPNPIVRSIYIDSNILTINTLPQTPFSRYKVTFQSIGSIKFRSKDEKKFLIEDGRSNVAKFISTEDDYDLTRNYLAAYLGGVSESVYDLSRESSVRKILNKYSTFLNKARSDIRATKNENYLEVFIKDEKKTRRFGPWDRLNQESAFEVVRVGKTQTNKILEGEISYTSFPTDPISLQQENYQEDLILGTGAGTFDNSLILSLTKYPVIKAATITIIYADLSTFDYEISSYGYRINDPKYDTLYGRTLITLEDNQIKLNDALLEDDNFEMPGSGDIIRVSYYYKSLGKIIDEESVDVIETIQVVRENAPAISVLFSLKNAPITTYNDKDPTSNGIEFLDPFSTQPFRTTHPAFLNEIPYREGGYPSRAGDYAIDYETGRVFVYGAEDNDGTGNFPPVMNYYYRKTYVDGLDYTYVPEYYDVVASPLRDLSTKTAKITFLYEKTLVPGIDYIANVHEESRNERIENRLASLNSIYTSNSPITDVFRIYNETTGEIYNTKRISNNRIYFDYLKAPNVNDFTRERVSFIDVLNESLILEQEYTNTHSIRVLKIRLQNQYIMSNTEDVIGSSYNSSVIFSDETGIFSTELYYDSQELTETNNINKLSSVGYYTINYRSGIIYVAVSDSYNGKNLGTVTYKKPVISPKNSHVISVSEVYCSLSETSGKSKILSYSSFDEGEITPVPTLLDYSDERYNDGDPYIFDNSTITVTNDIKSIRGIYDAYDLNNNIEPTNFAESATFSANIITLDSTGISKTVEETIIGSGLVVTVPLISTGIVIGTVSRVTRVSDGQDLLDGYESIVENTITLGGSSGAVAGDVVNVQYTVILNGSSTPIIDYNHGDMYIDYSALLDEILVTYEWGDNVIDFRNSTTLEENDIYYVSYKIGALRNALLNNFGSLVQIDELQSFDEELDREVYRDILQGALQSFPKGPTKPALEALISSITQINPRISAAEFWTLAESYLEKVKFEVLGDAYLTTGVFDQGIVCKEAGDGVSIPISNNLRLEEGTMEMCIVPEWDGIDNDAVLTFELYKDGYALSSENIFIGASSYNPSINSITNKFSVSKTSEIATSNSSIGLPALIFTSSTGVFIYYDIDNKQWKILAKDVPVSGSSAPKYTGTITTSGAFYDVKYIPTLGEINDVLRSGNEEIEFEFNINGIDVTSPDGYDGYDGYSIVSGYSFDGLQFMSDNRHYFFDFGTNEGQNRFSLYKDGRGYLVFEVWDKGGIGDFYPDRRNVYQVSTDIQDWVSGNEYNVAISWALNSTNQRDEMHLYVNGLEVPNIAKYGNIPEISINNRFRTVVPEQVVGVIAKNSRVGDDLETTNGSEIVSSASIDFTNLGIDVGDSIEILEQGFGTYIIASISESELVLSGAMPATLSNARFSINPVEMIVETEIDIYANIGVFTLDGYDVETEIPGERADIPSYSIERNSLNQRILKILGNVDVGDIVLIKTFGLNHRRCRGKAYLWNDSNILKTMMPPPINLDDVKIKSVILPLTSIGPENATYSVIDGYFEGSLIDGYSQPSNQSEGRILSIRVTGDNVIFPVEITINGISDGGFSETITVTSAGTTNTTNKWMLISSIDVVATPIISTEDSTAIEIKEAYSVTEPNGNNLYPVIRFAYKASNGISLTNTEDGYVADLNGYFPESVVGNLIEITSPSSIAGLYEIEERIDNNTIRLDQDIFIDFTGGIYSIYNISIGRSGFQNGFFFLETAGFADTPYNLPEGWYELDYSTYLSVPFDPIDQVGVIGNDINLTCPSNAVIDEFRILNKQLTDTRVGETIEAGNYSITTGANKISPFVKNKDTLVLLHFDDVPLVNDVDFYKFAEKSYVQSGESVNTTFGHSIVIKDKGMSFDNNGRLDTSNEGLIEFWVSPIFDTYNDPNMRVYFDAAASLVEEAVSLTKGIVKVSRNISEVLSVKIDSENAHDIDYFKDGTISSDRKTISLNSPLPYQNTPVKVSYIPTGVQGDRITISKSVDSYIEFTVTAQGKEFQVRQPVFWARNTWHRIRASFKFNTSNNIDQIRLFVDGEEKGNLLFGQDGLLFGSGLIWGQSAIGVLSNQNFTADINFTDTIIKFSLGEDFAGQYGAQARFDNLKLSNKAIEPLSISGQPMDVYYNTNSNYIYPSVEDVYTTFLYDFDKTIEKTEDFAVIQHPNYGIFNFNIDIIDSFNIVTGDDRVQNIVEALIDALKPAASKVWIKYFS